MRRTKIVATLGPATDSYEKVRDLVSAGMDVARLNFSHGTHEMHRRWHGWVRAASDETGRNVAVLQDIQGPKLRVGRFPGGEVELEPGATVTLTTDDTMGSEDLIPVDYPYLTEDVEEGHRIVLADGLIVLEATAVGPFGITAVVKVGGPLGDRKGVACPDTRLRTPAVTMKDREDLELGRELGVDYVAASFVSTGEDVRQVQELCGDAPVVAKIELAVAYENLDEILAEADGVMVARGDLGVQLPLERIPIIQADILTRTNAAGRLSITATEMLESMTNAQRPTRAEVTDVANAVLGGTDAVMLSGETAVGRYSVRTVETMARICQEAEMSPMARRQPVPFVGAVNRVASAVAQAATEAATHLGISTIVAFTESGNTARLISKYRPAASIVAFSASEETRRRMALYWGVTAYDFQRREYTDHEIAAAEKFLEREKLCHRGDLVVMVAGIPPNQRSSTNLMKIHLVGERETGVLSQRSQRRSPEVGGLGV
ncbi:MAG: pyruvate kinase [Actinomycetota bacterium]